MKNKFRLILIVLTIIFTGCAQLTVRNSVDTKFSPFLEDFFRLYKKSPTPLIVRFAAHEGGGFHGTCSITEHDQMIIEVSHAAWDSLCPAQQRALIFHELGHCLLRREHVTEATSYMYFGLLPCEHYDRNLNTLDVELFSTLN